MVMCTLSWEHTKYGKLQACKDDPKHQNKSAYPQVQHQHRLMTTQKNFEGSTNTSTELKGLTGSEEKEKLPAQKESDTLLFGPTPDKELQCTYSEHFTQKSENMPDMGDASKQVRGFQSWKQIWNSIQLNSWIDLNHHSSTCRTACPTTIWSWRLS